MESKMNEMRVNEWGKCVVKALYKGWIPEDYEKSKKIAEIPLIIIFASL